VFAERLAAYSWLVCIARSTSCTQCGYTKRSRAEAAPNVSSRTKINLNCA
jgi:hypothetical protein